MLPKIATRCLVGVLLATTVTQARVLMNMGFDNPGSDYGNGSTVLWESDTTFAAGVDSFNGDSAGLGWGSGIDDSMHSGDRLRFTADSGYWPTSGGAAHNQGSWFGFTVAASIGYQLDLDGGFVEICYDAGGSSGAYPRNLTLYLSSDGFATSTEAGEVLNIPNGPAKTVSIPINGSALNGLIGPVGFRVCIWNDSGTGTYGFFEFEEVNTPSIKLNGEVVREAGPPNPLTLRGAVVNSDGLIKDGIGSGWANALRKPWSDRDNWSTTLVGGTEFTLAQVDANGFPNAVGPGEEAWLRLRVGTSLTGMNIAPGDQDYFPQGLWALVWEGDGDMEVHGVTPVISDLAATPKVRIYDLRGRTGSDLYVRIFDNASANYVRHAKLWIPDPYATIHESDLTTQTAQWLAERYTMAPAVGEPEPVFNPLLIDLLSRPEIMVLRNMDAAGTNGSPLETWDDRRLPGYLVQNKSPHKDRIAEGDWVDEAQQKHEQGSALEYWILLANATGKDLWVCLPHAADNDFIRNFAQLAAFGSDANGLPYTAPQANPVYPPLDPDLRLWLEYSNEVWHGRGTSTTFHIQGTYAADQALALGLGTHSASGLTPTNSTQQAALYAGRRLAEIWSIFAETFGGGGRLINVAAGWAINVNNYNTYLIEEANAYGAILANQPGFSVNVAAEVLATATYFGNKISIFERLGEFLWSESDGDFALATDDLKRQLYSGASETNQAGDTISGGIRESITVAAVQYGVSIVTYEGGPNYDTFGFAQAKLNPEGDGWVLTDSSDPDRQQGRLAAVGAAEAGYLLYPADPTQAPWYSPKTSQPEPNNPAKLYNWDTQDSPYMWFIFGLQRDPAFLEAYRLQMELAHAGGLLAQNLFTDIAQFNRSWSWGHVEHLGQDPATTVKWQAHLDYHHDHVSNGLQPLNLDPQATGIPRFETGAILPPGLVGSYYQQDIVVSGGDGTHVIEAIAPTLAPGLSGQQIDGMTYRISGTPTATDLIDSPQATSYVLLRGRDADGDVGYRIYQMEFINQGAVVSLFEFDTFGTDAGQPTQTVDSEFNAPGTEPASMDRGPGIDPSTFGAGYVGGHQLEWGDLATAIANDSYVSVWLSSADGFALTLDRLDYSLMNRGNDTVNVALMSDRTGFTVGDELGTFSSPDTGNSSILGLSFPLNHPALANLTTPVELRFYLWVNNAEPNVFGDEFGIGIRSDIGSTNTANDVEVTVWGSVSP